MREREGRYLLGHRTRVGLIPPRVLIAVVELDPVPGQGQGEGLRLLAGSDDEVITRQRIGGAERVRVRLFAHRGTSWAYMAWSGLMPSGATVRLPLIGAQPNDLVTVATQKAPDTPTTPKASVTLDAPRADELERSSRRSWAQVGAGP